MGKNVATTGGQAPQTEKLSYEQLEQVCSQLDQQARALQFRLEQTASVFRRLDYLFKVLENERCFDPSYVQECADEIKQIMTIEEPKEETKE